MAQDRDIASYGQIGTQGIPLQLWAGEAQILTDSAPSLAPITKYQLCALTATGITPFVVATHNASQAVVAAQPAAGVGSQVPYWNAGPFNWKAVIFPAGTALDTLAEIKAYFNQTGLQFKHLLA